MGNIESTKYLFVPGHEQAISTVAPCPQSGGILRHRLGWYFLIGGAVAREFAPVLCEGGAAWLGPSPARRNLQGIALKEIGATDTGEMKINFDLVAGAVENGRTAFPPIG